MIAYEIFHERQMAMTDEQLKAVHGDNFSHSIARWRAELKAGMTTLCYIDWRADRMWCAARREKGS